jgi:hypothetical protein
MDGREVAEQHGQTARAIAEQRFAIENTVERLYELYEQVFSTH